MLTQYTLTLSPSAPCAPGPEWGYRLYAALLERAPERFGAAAHEDAVTPLSQFVTAEKGLARWSVNLLGQESEAAFGPILSDAESFLLKRDGLTLTVSDRAVRRVPSVDALLLAGAAHAGVHSLRFQTPTAFKSRGEYQILPTPRLIVQSLIKKWNGCFPDCPIEDEDGEGLDALAAGLRCGRFRLRDSSYRLKGAVIPGFLGEMTLENRMTGFQRELANALLLFAGFSGIGIKTALGMGGVELS